MSAAEDRERERQDTGAVVSIDEASKVVVEIDLAALWVGGEKGSSFAEYVAEVAARKLVAGDQSDAIAEIRRRYAAKVDAEVREQVAPLVREALEQAASRTDAFGTARGGEPQTLREMIVELVRREVSEKRDRGYGKQRATLVEEIIRAEVADALGKELRAVVADAKRDVLAAVREQAAEVITETIERVRVGRL